MSITIHQGSILDCRVDAIVNPANGHLKHDGGLARIIANAACEFPPGMHEGDRDSDIAAWEQEQEDHPLLATGNAGWTSAGTLRFKAIIHAVGPIWNSGGFYEPHLLARAHNSALRTAYDLGCKSLAIPAISCGIFGYPVEFAAPIAVREVTRDSWGYSIDVVFALFEDAHVEAYTKALEAS